MESGGGRGGEAEEGNSLKKHYVTKECLHGSVFKGPGLRGKKGGFVGADLAASQADGRALLPVWFRMFCGSVWLPLLQCKKFGAAPSRSIVLKFALFPEGILEPC